MPRFLTLIAVTSLLLCGCQGRPSPTEKASKKPAIKAAASVRLTPRQALAMGGHVLVRALSGHRLSIKATTSSVVSGYPTRKVIQEMTWLVDGKGNFRVRKDTHKQYGQEVILHDGWLYARLRYSKFVRRRPRQGEAHEILDRMASHLPDYAELLERFLKMEPAGEGKLGQMEGTRVSLSLRETPLPAGEAASGPARRWRASVAVTALSGTILFDEVTGVPLSVDLKANLTFKAPRPGKAPPASGIPSVLSDKLKGTMSLALTQRAERVGKAEPVKPPPAEETITDVRRRRLDLERQLLSGERPLPDDWSLEP